MESDFITKIIRSASLWIIVANLAAPYEIFRHLSVLMMIYGTRVTLNPKFLHTIPWPVKIVSHLIFHWAIPIAYKHVPKKRPSIDHTFLLIAMLYVFDKANPDLYRITHFREEVLLLIVAYHVGSRVWHPPDPR